MTAALLIIGTTLPARAIYIITATETGGNVVFSSPGGSLDLTAWTFSNPSGGNALVDPSIGIIQLGSIVFTADAYVNPLNFNGPTSFGPGGWVGADAEFGETVAILPGIPILGVPVGYMSGAPLSAASMTFNGASFASLGITPGTSGWSWGPPGEVEGDTLILQVGAQGRSGRRLDPADAGHGRGGPAARRRR